MFRYDLTSVQKSRQLLRKGKALYKKKEYEEAIEWIEKSIEECELANAWRFKGRCLRDLDRCEEALKAFDLLVKMQPGNLIFF